jgi:hypothetical protein
MNDAAPIGSIAQQLAILAAWAVLTFLVGLKIFRWQ